MIKTIGIRHETKSPWEKRVPLTPEHVKQLQSQTGLQFHVQPSSTRIFPDSEYAKTGAKMSENISDCDFLMGVKEMPIDTFKPNGAYMFFSHTTKAQPYNMAMLKRLQELKCTLIDYEQIVDEKNRRLVFFGRFAGLAGMIDTLWTLGKRFEAEGFSTAFNKIRMAHGYSDLENAKTEIRKVGEEIAANGLPKGLPPVIVGFTGYGNVSRGAQEIMDLLPHREISPEELLTIDTSTLSNKELLKVVFYERHTVKPKDEKAAFDLAEYFEFPERYQTAFRPYLDHLTVLVNCIFWSAKAPMVLSRSEAAEIWADGKSPMLKVIGDISCDINGGVELTAKETQPDDPSYLFDVPSGTLKSEFTGRGPVIMAVDNLPCELSREASMSFGDALAPFVGDLTKLDLTQSWEEAIISQPLREAVLLWRGEFPEKYAFMKDFID